MGAGVGVHYNWAKRLGLEASAGLLTSQAALDINQSLPGSTQIARLKNIEGKGYQLRLASRTPIRDSIFLSAGISVKRLSFALPSEFSYEQTDLVGSGLSLSNTSSRDANVQVPDLKTRYQSIFIGLEIPIAS